MGKIVIAVSLASSLVLSLALSTAVAAEQPVAASTAADAAAYKPRTEHDNTPWRFNMEQDGKRMTADQFDAWMKSKGVRVAKGAVSAAPAVASTTAETQAPASAAVAAAAPVPSQAAEVQTAE